MRRLPFLAMLLMGACAPSVPAYVPAKPLPLDANGLPPLYSLCVRNAALKSVAIYDVYYGCRDEIAFYLAGLRGPSQQEKAEMADAMEPKAMDYAQQQVIDRHGAEAVRAALMGLPAPPRAVNHPL